MTRFQVVRRGLEGLAVVVALAFAGVMAARVLGGVQMARAVREFEARVGPLDRELGSIRAGLEEDDEILPGLAQSLETLWDRPTFSLPEVHRLSDVLNRRAGDWTTDEVTLVRDLLAATAEPRHELQDRVRAARSAPVSPPDSAARPSAHIPLWSVGFAADLLAGEAILALREGREPDAAGALDTLGALVQGFRTSEPSPKLSRALACQGRWLLAARAWVESPAATVAGLDRCAAGFSAGPDGDDLRRWVLGRAAFLYSFRPGTPRGDHLPILQGRRLRRIAYFSTAHRSFAEALDTYRVSLARLETESFAAVSADTEALRLPRASLLNAEEVSSIAPSRRFPAAQWSASRSMTRLARFALELRRAQLRDAPRPEPPPGPDDFTGTVLTLHRRADGGVTLELPGAAELCRRRVPSDPRWAPVFEYRLPAGPAP